MGSVLGRRGLRPSKRPNDDDSGGTETDLRLGLSLCGALRTTRRGKGCRGRRRDRDRARASAGPGPTTPPTSFPGCYPNQKPTKRVRRRRRAVQQRRKPLERLGTESEIPLIEQYVLGFPARRFQHKLGTALAEHPGRSIDEIAVPPVSADANRQRSDSISLIDVCHDLSFAGLPPDRFFVYQVSIHCLHAECE
jgi:hypothetical protein